MSDELSIQQQDQVSKTPYVLTGGVIGGAGVGIPTYLMTKPQYGSHNEIVEEATKADEFQKKIEAAEGEEKQFLEDAKKVAEAKTDAEKKYQEELDAYIEEHTKEKARELDPNCNELKNLKTAEDALAAKKQSALNDEIARITREENARTVTPQDLEKIREEAKKIENVVEHRTRANTGKYDSINRYIGDRASSDISEVETELDRYAKDVKKLERYEKILSKQKVTEDVHDLIEVSVDKRGNAILKRIEFGPGITEADRKNLLEYVQQAKIAAQKHHDINLRNINGGMLGIQGTTAEERHALAEQIKNALVDTRSLNENKEVLTNGIKKKAGEFETIQREMFDAYQERMNRDRTPILAPNNTRHALNGIGHQFVDDLDKKKIADLTKDIDKLKFADTVQKLNGYSLAEGTTVIKGHGNAGDIIDKILKGDFNFEATSTQQKLSLAEQEEVRQLQSQLKDQVAKIKEDIKANFTKDGKKAVPTEAEVNAKFLEAIRAAEGEQNVTSRIAALEGELNPIKEALTKRQELGTKWRNLHLELKTYLGEGYTLERDTAGNVTKIILADGKEFTADSIHKFTGKIAVPNGKYTEAEFKQLQKIFASANVEKMTPEQIKAKAEEIVNARVFKAEQEAVNAARTAVEEAKTKLPKVEVMTKEAATDAFHKAKEVAGKDDFISKEAKSKTEEFVEKYAKKFEGKLGKNAGWKLAGIIAGGAVLGGLIGSAFAPKRAQD